MKIHNLPPTAAPKAAVPETLAASADLVPMMTSGGNRNGLMGTGDRRPMIYRQGSLDAYQLPSRMGSKLRHPGGVVEPVVRHLPAEDTEGGAL